MDVDSLFGGQTKAGEMDLQFIMQTTVTAEWQAELGALIDQCYKRKETYVAR